MLKKKFDQLQEGRKEAGQQKTNGQREKKWQDSRSKSNYSRSYIKWWQFNGAIIIKLNKNYINLTDRLLRYCKL